MLLELEIFKPRVGTKRKGKENTAGEEPNIPFLSSIIPPFMSGKYFLSLHE